MSKFQEPIAMVSDTNGAVAEAYRSLRVALSKQLAQGKSIFAFVSAWPGDGKSMVCTNVAIALAQMHQKVLLIDGDLRRPTISRVFGAQDKRGMSDDLENQPDKILLGYATRYANTFVLPRGLSERNPANLLSPSSLSRLFNTLKPNFDIIIIDTPPLSACSDALLLAGQADGAVLVVNPKGWDGEVEARYKQQVTEHGIPLFGVVLNGALGGESFGYGYGYGSGYGYGGSYGHYGEAGRKARPKPARSSFSWPWQRPDQQD